MLIDVAIPGNRNGIKKEAEKILQYKNLILEIQRMWNVRAKVILVMKGATGIILKALRKYLNNIPGKHKIKEIQKQAILGTANVKVQNMFHGQNSITCSTHCKYRTAATLYTLETWFISGI